MAHSYVTASDLPQALPVFPLDGALLLPRGQLPLNIFEPRYLNMIDDVMAGDRLIGMIQTTGGSRERPALAPIGCAGRITHFAETSDGRYLITLTGVARFRVTRCPRATAPSGRPTGATGAAAPGGRSTRGRAMSTIARSTGSRPRPKS